MKKLINITLAITLLVLFAFSSCTKIYEMNQPDEPDIEYSAIWPMSGEWWVTYKFDDGAGNIGDWYGVGYTQLFTYNTANEDKDKMWINDQGNFWTYTIKTPLNLGAMSFSGTDLVSTAFWSGEPYDIKISIQNGQVIPDGGKSTSGVTTDSIYFEIIFEDDPSTTYICSGVRRTGFLEDEH